MAVILKCPVCRGKFKYDVSVGWPDFCQIPECGADINNRRADDEICMPAFLSQKSKNNDKVARDIMDGSVQRAEMAAAMAGTSPEEMSSLKITDLNDRNDTQFATKDIVNPVTQHMDAMQRAGMPVGFGAGNSDAMARAAQAHAPMVLPDGRVMQNKDTYAGLRERNRLQRIMTPVGQAPLPLQISNNPNYRSPV
jgi:hypothetical protein